MSATERVPRPAAFRLVLGAIALAQLANGVWALVAPRSFYGEFPFGRAWVEALPAYNEHLTRDVGALFIATAVVLGAAAWTLRRPLVDVAIVAWLVFAVPHAAYHVANLGVYGSFDAVANAVTLGATVIAPLWLGILLMRDRGPGRAASSPSAEGGRIAGVPESSRNPLVRMAYRSSRRQAGAVLDPVKVFAHHPTMLWGYGMLELAAQRSDSVPDRLKHLAETRAGMLAGCEWCLDFASAISEENGVGEEDLRDLHRYRDSERFSELEKLALAYADAMTRTPAAVPDHLFDALRSHLDERQLVELTAMIALENYRARFNWAFGLKGQGFAEGAFCVRPDPIAAGATA